MKLKMKLDKIVDTKQLKGEKWDYVWVPTDKKYKKLIQLRIVDTYTIDTTGDFEMPIDLDDVILIDLMAKETQSKLDEKKKTGDK